MGQSDRSLLICLSQEQSEKLMSRIDTSEIEDLPDHGNVWRLVGLVILILILIALLVVLWPFGVTDAEAVHRTDSQSSIQYWSSK